MSLPAAGRLQLWCSNAIISISQEVGDQAEGPWGQVPGQLLQLTQQAFDFCLQVLHRLLHRLLYDIQPTVDSHVCVTPCALS